MIHQWNIKCRLLNVKNGGAKHKEIKARRKGRRYVRLLIGTKSSPSEASSVLKQVIAISAR